MEIDYAIFLRRVVGVFSFLILSFYAQGQSCNPATSACTGNCVFPVTVEKGCNCYDGKDNDGDGKIDISDPDCASYYGLEFVGSGSNCSINPPPGTNVFTGISNKSTSSQNTADTPAHISVGDMNGDGVPDAVVTSKWNSTVSVVSTTTTGGFKPGDIMGDFTTPGSKIFPTTGGDWVFEHETAIADIDGDKIGEMYVIASMRKGGPNNPPTEFALCGFKYATGKGNLIPLFDAVDLGTDRPGSIGLADFNGDGLAEVYLKNQIYDAATGKKLADGGGNWDTQINSAPVAVDMTGDGKLELVCGNFIYTVPTLSRSAANTLTVYKDMNTLGFAKFYPKGYNDVNEYGVDQASSTSTADFDGDGFVDVFMTGAINCSGNESSPCGTNTTTIFYWNVQKGTVQTYAPPDATYPLGWVWGTGRINLDDANGDGKLEALFTAGSKLFCMGSDASGNLILLWTRTMNDALSGILSLTVYDFDNDGNPEVVYRDTQQLVICDGKTGANTKWAVTCQSHTFTEGPIIADVNGDGATDICVTCYTNVSAFDINKSTPQQQSLGQIQLYYTDANTWLPTRKVWNQHPYFVTNILDNLRLPTTQMSPDLVFSNAPCPNGVPGPQRPFNLFMDQVPHLSANGCPEFPAPDLTFYGDDPAQPGVDTNGDGVVNPTVVVIPPICGNLGIKAYFNIVNNGDLGITDKVPVSFFNGDPTISPVTAKKLFDTTMYVTNLNVGSTYKSPTYSFNGPGNSFNLYIVLYNNGAVLPINLTGSSTKECSISNNMYSVPITPSPFTVTVEKIQDNFKCSNSAPNNGILRAHIFVGSTEIIDYSPYAFQWYTGTTTTSPIAGATQYNLQNLDAGTYSVIVTNTQKGCSSALISGSLIRTGVDPPISVTLISDQSKCTPPNGELLATITDGSTGYTYNWFDINGLSLGITTADAKNLPAGNYLVQVSKGGCTKNSPPITVNGPQQPDAQASTVSDVVDCLNPNSGSVTADAVVGGAIANAANYTFDWYFYDNNTGLTGSILPASSGTGQTRTALAVGYYQVVVTDNTTGCKATNSPFTQVQSSTVLPTASISQVTPQTSCDPNKPNGVLTAIASATGFNNPTDFTFQWFRGDNTLASNLVPIGGGPETVSGSKGETLNSAKGGGIVYTVKVITPLNCSATTKATVDENIKLPVLTLTQLAPNTVCDATKATTPYNGSIIATVTFAGSSVSLPNPNYSFKWYDGTTTTTPHVPPTSGGPTLTALKDGDYAATVTRTDLFCTSAVQTVPVDKATVLPNLSPTSTGSNNCDATLTPDGTVSVSVTNTIATDVFSYQWYKGAVVGVSPLGAANNGTSSTAIKVGGPNGAPTQYTVYVLNKTTGCENNTSQFVADNSVVPVLSTSTVPNSVCSPSTLFVGSVTATVTNIPAGYTASDYTFNWYDGNTTATPHVPATTLSKLSTLDANTYSVIAKNTKTGCTSALTTDNVGNGKIMPIIAITATGSHNCSPSLIPDGRATASVTNQGTDPLIYSWSAVAPAAPLTAANNPGQPTAIKLGGPTNAPNSYSITVLNGKTGCTSTTGAQVADISAKPTFPITATDNQICSITVPGGPTSYDGHVDIGTVSNNIAPGYAGTATYTYNWFNADPVTGVITGPNNSSSTATLGQLAKGKFAATVMINELGCVSDPMPAEVKDNLIRPIITPQTISNVRCVAPFNGSAQVTQVDGGPAPGIYKYQWYDGGVVDPIQIRAADISPVLSTTIQGTSTFTVQVTNPTTGCDSNLPMTVVDGKVTPTIALSVVQDNTMCLGTPNGELLATVANAGAAFTITWSVGGTQSGAAGDHYINLPKGSYSAHVTDNTTACTSVDDSKNILDDLTYPLISISNVDQTSCDSSNPNGSLTATATVGAVSVPVTYSWFDGTDTSGSGTPHTQTSPNSGVIDKLAVSTSGGYTVVVVANSTQCSSTQTDNVANNITNPIIDITGIGLVTSCTSPNGSATVTVVSGLSTPTKYDIYYVFTSTSSGNAYPTDPVAIKGAGNPNNKTGQTSVPPSPSYTNMVPGYLTALVVDVNTSCESDPITRQIIDNTRKSSIALAVTASPGVCNGGGGGLDPSVTFAPPLPAPIYTYEWYKGAPNNTGTINFYNNPPTFAAGSLIFTDNGSNPNLGVNHTPSDGSINPGTFTLVVRDQDGCGTYKTDNVPTNLPPTISIAPTDRKRCDINDGSLDVQVTGGAGGGALYSINVYSGNNNSAPPTPGGTLAPSVAGTHLIIPNLGEGPYFVEIVDQANPTCPMGKAQSLQKLVLPPIVSINSIGPNTSCSPNPNADGSVDITVTSDASDAQAKMYKVNKISPVVPTYVTPFIIPENPPASGKWPTTVGGLSPKDYIINIRDSTSKCFTNVNVTIPDQQDVPQDLLYTPSPETMCANLSNGSATVSLQPLLPSPAEVVTDFNFTWSKNNDLSAPLMNAIPGGGGTNGELINQAQAGVGWPMGGVAGQGNGNRTFFVQGVKNASAGTGVGCKTSILQVDIPDQHISPDMTLTPSFNSFCGATSLNGALGDGTIIIVADADPGTAGQQNAAGGFDYSWTNANAGLASPHHDPSNNLTIPKLGTGSYQVTATNSTNKCTVTNAVNVDAAPFVITIDASVTIDQRICSNDGRIKITQITLKDNSASGTNTVTDTDADQPASTATNNLQALYDFAWYTSSTLASPLNGVGVTPITAQILSNDSDKDGVVNEPGDYAAIQAGTYYVVATRSDNTKIGFGCPSLPYHVDIKDVHQNPSPALTALSNTSCLSAPGSDEGEIIINTTDATNSFFKPAGGFTYGYTWSGGAAATLPANGSGNGNGVNGDFAGDIDHFTQLRDAVTPYAVKITNNQSGCFANGSATIIKNATPVFVQSVAVKDQILCADDGSIQVTKVSLNDRAGTNQDYVSGFVPPQGDIANFDFIWTRTGYASQTTTGVGGNLLDKNNYDASVTGFNSAPLGIGAGTYTVTAKRKTGTPGAGCASAPYQVVIQNKQVFPSVQLTPFANTSCDISFFEGEISVKVTDLTPVTPPAGGFKYNYTWTLSATPSLTAGNPYTNNDGDGFGGGETDAGNVVDNDSDHPKSLQEGNYSIQVINPTTGCSNTGATTIYKNGTPVFTQLVGSTPQILCKPDGMLEVKEVLLKDRFGNNFKWDKTKLATDPDYLNIADFDFDWTTPANTIVTTHGTIGVASGGVILDNNPVTGYPAIGFGTYYVVTKRVSGSPGKDCSSPPYKVDIDDQRKLPKVDFNSLTNSSCNSLKPNGSIIASASEQNGTNTDPYTFSWTLNRNPIGPLAPNPTQVDASPKSTLTNAIDGAYIVTVTNTNTGCPFDASINLLLDQTRSTPNIIDVSTVDPLDCNPSASAQVTKITIGSTTNSTLFPPNIPPNNIVTGAALANYTYSWYSGTPTNQISGATLPSITNIAAGKYFVEVLDPTTDCKSGPKEFDIKTDNIIYPVVNIAQTIKQISCVSTIGTAALQASVVEQDGTTGTYNFSWHPSLDLTGPAFTPPQAPSTTTNPNPLNSLFNGNYSVEVTNMVTSCKASAFFVIPDESPFFKPELSAVSSPLTFCVGLDGDVQVRTILNPLYPLPFSFKADLYFGAAPNLSGPPDIANVPLVPGTTFTFDQPGMTFGTYTFKVTDNNTGCVTTDTTTIKDKRTKPVIVIIEDHPMTNCDPAIANGQLSATADNGKIQGYTFDWYAGASAAGSILQSNDKLIGQRAPGPYTVLVTNNFTGCADTKSHNVTDATVKPPSPSVVVIQDRTSCVMPNGELSANVRGETINYTFQWYNGSQVKPTPDFNFNDYTGLDIGPYVVTATDDITGCVSQPVQGNIADKRVTPSFELSGTPSYCIDTGKPNGNGIVELKQNNSNYSLADIQWTDLSNNVVVGLGPQVFNLFPGTYQAVATSTEGCKHDSTVVVGTEINPYNLVSSNNDGKNDGFIIDCISMFPNNNVKIFNRSGVLVYEADNYDNSNVFFRGVGDKGVYFSSRELPEGTYFYIIDKRNGSKPRSGYLELVR